MALRNRRPEVEAMEGRVVLSTGGTAATGVFRPHHIALNGEVSGKFSLSPGVPDAGSSER